jgi:hypothetical protein
MHKSLTTGPESFGRDISEDRPPTHQRGRIPVRLGPSTASKEIYGPFLAKRCPFANNLS